MNVGRQLCALIFCILAIPPSFAKNYLSSTYPHDVLEKCLVMPGEFRPVPTAASSFWRDSIPETIRKSYIAYGETYLGKDWPALRGRML